MFETATLSLHASIESVLSDPITAVTREETLVYMEDVAYLLSSTHFVVDALQDMLFIVESAVGVAKTHQASVARMPKSKANSKSRKAKSKAFKALMKDMQMKSRKLKFLLSYANELDSDALSKLRLEVLYVLPLSGIPL